MRTVILTLLLGLGVFNASAGEEAQSVDLAGRELRLRDMVDGIDLELSGVGVLSLTRFFRIYAAALYLPPGKKAADVLSDIPKRLDILYLHETPAHRMIGAAEKSLERTLSKNKLEALRPRIGALHRAYVDGREGGRASLTYLPGKGTTFAMDGKTLVTIEGGDFAEAYFSVWFGEYAASMRMKKQLMEPLMIEKRLESQD